MVANPRSGGTCQREAATGVGIGMAPARTGAPWGRGRLACGGRRSEERATGEGGRARTGRTTDFRSLRFCHGGNLNALPRGHDPASIVVPAGFWRRHFERQPRMKPLHGDRKKQEDNSGIARTVRAMGDRRAGTGGSPPFAGVFCQHDKFFWTGGERFRGRTASIGVKGGTDTVAETRTERMNLMKSMAMVGWLVLGGVACVGLCGCSGGGAQAQALRAARAQELGAGTVAGETKTIALPGGAAMEMVWCPPGAFTMGSPVGEAGRDDDEKQRRVTVTNGFWMAKTEVTQAQWQSVTGKNPSEHKGDDNLPVENVSWKAARKFCNRTGLQLPIEAEWEYACRAGSTEPYAGSGRLDEMGWYKDNSGSQTHPVGGKSANAWGLMDMHGNVSEWCEDQDWSAGGTRCHILRSGCHWDDNRSCRSASRVLVLPASSSRNDGFRPIFRPD